MSFVVTEPCIACRFGECVGVCPVDAFHAGPNFMVIDPRTCINCGICELACPVEAIRADHALTSEQRTYADLNARLAEAWPVTTATTPLPRAEDFAAEKNKRHLLVLP
ncbi:ferredoxin family protein [Variovorax sp. UC122_21]|jgi:ferredoxin|uniref:ferredoxin family protein n=1 Tax=Variovorax TaxID=34072 RepID=UPI0019348304|nr:ferredoxin family protein [Variovorax paradoxus]